MLFTYVILPPYLNPDAPFSHSISSATDVLEASESLTVENLRVSPGYCSYCAFVETDVFVTRIRFPNLNPKIGYVCSKLEDF